MSLCHRLTHLLLFLAALLILWGCEDDVAGPEGIVEPFSMFGILNPRLEMQTMLVSPIEDRLRPLESTIDAAVTSTDLASGEVHPWRDSVVANETGQLDHVFWADFTPEYGSRHRIEVSRSDGSTAFVETDVPELVEVEQDDQRSQHFGLIVHGENVRVVNVRSTYGVRFYDSVENFLAPYSSYSFTSSPEITEFAEGWLLEFDLAADYDSLHLLYYNDHLPESKSWFFNFVCDGLGLEDLSVRLTIGSDDWDPPGGTYSPSVLAQPGTLTNVENGLGFVGGGYEIDVRLFPSTRSLDHTLFWDFIGRREPNRNNGRCR